MKSFKTPVTADVSDSSIYEHDKIGQSINFGFELMKQVSIIRSASSYDLMDLYINSVRTLDDMLYPYRTDEFNTEKAKLDKAFLTKLESLDTWDDNAYPNDRNNMLKNYSTALFRLLLTLMVEKGFLPEHSLVEEI